MKNKENDKWKVTVAENDLVISLTEKGNIEVEAVIRNLKKKGFAFRRKMDVGKANLIFGSKKGDLDGLRNVFGVESVEVQQIHGTTTDSTSLPKTDLPESDLPETDEANRGLDD